MLQISYSLISEIAYDIWIGERKGRRALLVSAKDVQKVVHPTTSAYYSFQNNAVIFAQKVTKCQKLI